MFYETKTFLVAVVTIFLFVCTVKGSTKNLILTAIDGENLPNIHTSCLMDLEAPQIICSDSDTSSVVFFWNPVEGATDYLVTVTSGQTYSLDGTTLTIDGLIAGETVNIEVQAISDLGEASIVVEATCTSLLCHTADISITPVPTICFPDTSGVLTSLDVQVASSSSGIGLWSGAGIVNPTMGTFDANAVGPGNHTIFYAYVTPTCTNLDSTTIMVREQGFADFASADAICLTDTTMVVFSGIAPDGAQFNWDFGNGTAISGSGEGPYEVHWDDIGEEFIGLSIDNDGCVSNLEFASINIDKPLEIPDVWCNPTFSDVEFVWNPVENANTYVINVINGPLGVQTSDTSYLLPDLMPGQEIGIRLFVVSNNTCPGNIQLPVCYSTYCPEQVDLISPIGPFCYDGLEEPDTIYLEHVLPDSLSFVSGVWTGNGVIDEDLGILVVDQSMAGQNEVYLNFYDDVCNFADTLVFEVINEVSADFTVIDSTCIVDTTYINYTGSTPEGSSFLWDFDGGTMVSEEAEDPIEVLWSEPGLKEVKLLIDLPGCTPDSSELFVEVLPELEAPQIVCETSTSSILFSWPTVVGAVDYPVTVLEGGMGVSTSDTSMFFDNLMPFDTVTIQVDAISGYLCSDTMAVLECVSVECPEIFVEATPIDPICYSVDTLLTLEAQVTGEVGMNGTTHWEGADIMDSVNGILSITESSIGQNLTVYAIYQEESCQYIDTLEISVLGSPVSSFTVLEDTICITDEAIITFDGAINPGEDYDWIWDFDEGLPVSGTEAGPYSIHWNIEGNHTVSLTVEGACTSQEFQKDIYVSTPLPPVVADCDATVDSMVISWPAISGANSYHIEILEGLPFTMSSDTSILITNLMPNQEVNFTFYPETGDVCGYIPYTSSCQTLDCPLYFVDIQALDDYCFDGQLDTILPLVQGNTDLSQGISTWSGLNVIDPTTGFLEINESSTLQPNELIFSYTEGFCEYQDTVLYNVYPVPVASFAGNDSICSTENGVFTFTGTAGSDAGYNWVFSAGTILSGTGIGPYEVQWGTQGDYNLSLTVEENNCNSDPFVSSIYVDVPLPGMVVECIAGLDSVWVSWNDYPLIDDYSVIEAQGFSYEFTSDTSIVFAGLSEGQTIDVTIMPNASSQCDLPIGTTSCTTISCGDAMLDWSVEPVCAGSDVEISFQSNTSWLFDILFEDEHGESYLWEDASDGSSMILPISVTTSFSITEIINKTISVCQLPFPADIVAEVNEITEVGTALDDLALCEGEDLSISLMNNIDGFVAGGVWEETSSVLSGAFDAANGVLQTGTMAPGHYSFSYRLASSLPCPDGEVSVGVDIHPNPIVDAGEDIQLGCNRLTADLGDAGTDQGMEYVYSWSADNGISIINSDQLFINVMDEGTYTLMVENMSTGCKGEDEVAVTADIDFPVLYLGVDPVSCFGENDGYVKVDSVVGGTPPYQYSFEGADFAQQFVFGPLSIGNYSVVVKDDNGCESSENISLTGADDWQLILSTNLPEGENVIQLGDKLTLEALVSLPENRVDSVIWTPDTLTFINDYLVTSFPHITSTYRVTVRDENGCVQEDFVTIYVDKKRDVFIPMAFSPNDDGVNDYFMIYAGQKVREVKEFSVFNRWGDLIFRKEGFLPNDDAFGWDGTLNGEKLNANVFIYSVEVELIDGEVIRLSGDVTLLR